MSDDAEVRAAVEGDGTGQEAMKNRKCLGKCLNKETQKKVEGAEGSTALEPASQDAMRQSDEYLAKALAGQTHVYDANLAPLMTRIECMID
jgi:hypothetical protein